MPAFSGSLTTPAIVPEQQPVVWTLSLHSESKGPSLISHAASHVELDVYIDNLLDAPSWRTRLD